MKFFFIAIFCLITGSVIAQPALYNMGNIRIHEAGQIGFHTNLINESSFDQNQGLAGFYGSQVIRVSGSFMPIFFDTEIFTNRYVELLTSLSTTNNANFINGDFRTPRAQPDIAFNLFGEATYIGAADNSKIDGYATINNQLSIQFPVGDELRLRPLALNSNTVNDLARCAYFFEDPNNPSSFSGFNTSLKTRNIAAISNLEFWHLEGSQLSQVTLTWDDRSAISILTSDPRTLTVVGWNKGEGRWLNLGNAAISGDQDSGFVTSLQFVPDDYAVLTLGSQTEPVEFITLANFILTPNGDGINDALEIPELLEYPDNSIQIFDRRGLKVFEMENYTGEFNGISNMDNLVIDKDLGLPEGIYFYLVSLDEPGFNFQGFLYLQRY